MENLTNLLNNLQITQVNQVTMASRLSDFKDGLQLLPDYDGKTKAQLNVFITSVDEFMTFVNEANPPLSNYERHVIKNGILKRITGEARDLVANTDRSDWPRIKETLQTQFLVCKHYTTIFHEIIILNIKDPYEYFKTVDTKFKELKDLLDYQYPVDDHIIPVLEQIVLYEFIGKVREPFASNIANRKPKTLKELGNLLINDFNFLKSRINNNYNNNVQNSNPKFTQSKSVDKKLPNIPPTPFPNNSFQLPITPTKYDQQKRNFASRQNIINAQRSQAKKPTPMSLNTRFIVKPNNSQTPYFRQNAKTPNFISEELFNQEQELDEIENDEIEDFGLDTFLHTRPIIQSDTS